MASQRRPFLFDWHKQRTFILSTKNIHTLSKPANMLSYRNATIEDLPQIVDIYNSVIPSGMVTADTTHVSVESKVQWFHKHSHDKRPLWIVENIHNEVFGWVSFQSFYGRPAYDATVEIGIYLHPTQRGKGVGKEILHYCLENASHYGIKTLLGFIFAHNEPSLHLFKKAGFAEWGMLPDVANLFGVERSLIIMGKRIA